jgi:hypothetical protein
MKFIPPAWQPLQLAVKISDPRKTFAATLGSGVATIAKDIAVATAMDAADGFHSGETNAVLDV